MATSLEPRLTVEERVQKRRLIMRDAAALLTLLVFTAALFALTTVLFRAFSSRRARLAQSWLTRGEAALHSGHPDEAVEALRSALEYAPGQRKVEIELAMALAAAGRTQEATSYFNTLWENEPGNGEINLALARLAARQGEETVARDDYHAAIYGTWEGDGSVRRREVRLELVQYLLKQKRYEQARNELLIAAGNAPDDSKVKLQIASLFESAGDNANAAQLYHEVIAKTGARRSPDVAALEEALEGAGRTTFALGEYRQARDALERALNQPGIEAHPAVERDRLGSMLRDAVHILLLYPSATLPPRERAERILHARSIAAARFGSCLQPGSTSLGSDNSLAERWKREPPRLTAAVLQRDGALEETELQLVYDTERMLDTESSVGTDRKPQSPSKKPKSSGAGLACGPPTGDDALLLRIAQRPELVDQP